MADLQEHVQCPCFKYADDTTFYLHSKVSKLDDCTTGLNDAIVRLENYSTDSNLTLNAKKTKWILLSTTQMSRVHSLDSYTLNVNCKGDPLERVQSTTLLGLHLDQPLTWNEHITKTLASCYGTLAVLRKLKYMAPYHVRKRLVISKLDYASVLFDPLPAYQLRCLQRVQNACAGFVLRKYANESDLVTLNWLDMAKRRKLSVFKLTFKSLNDTNFPEYLKLSTHAVSAYNLRFPVAPLLCIPKESSTFHDTAATFYNSLPSHVRNITVYGYYYYFCSFNLSPLLSHRKLYNTEFIS